MRASAKGLTLDVKLVDDLPERVLGDSLRLGQALTNLVGNAIKFTEKGSVAVSVVRDGNLTRFDISDTGIGIADTELQDVMLPFVQADGSTTRQYGGSGLGLAIVRQLVDLMNGELRVNSRLGHGSTFWFTAHLPVSAN